MESYDTAYLLIAAKDVLTKEKKDELVQPVQRYFSARKMNGASLTSKYTKLSFSQELAKKLRIDDQQGKLFLKAFYDHLLNHFPQKQDKQKAITAEG